MGFGIEEVPLIKVLMDLRQVEHTSSIDMQVLTDLKRGLWPHRCISHSVLTDLGKVEHTFSIDMQGLADLKRGLWPHRCISHSGPNGP